MVDAYAVQNCHAIAGEITELAAICNREMFVASQVESSLRPWRTSR